MLEPIRPEKARELYLADREAELSQATLYSHRSRIGHFVRWCHEQELTNLKDLNGRLLHEFRLWRREDGDLSSVSEKTQMNTIRVFIRWLEAIDGVQQDLSTKVQSPSLDVNEDVRDVMPSHDSIEEILAYFSKYRYASIEHVTFALMWHTMMRVGSIHALDLQDYDAGDQYLEVHHRPDTGTPIKNKENGERLVALSPAICDLLDDWLDDQRPSVVDDFGREPLVAASHGRAHRTTLRSYVYAWTRPCMYGAGCPHDRDSEECEAIDYDQASRCPSTVSPHAIRRGSITHALNSDVPAWAVSDRANVSLDILDRHYDRRSEREKMEQRRSFLDNI